MEVDPISAENLDGGGSHICMKARWEGEGGLHIIRKPRWCGDPISAGILDGWGDPICAGNLDGEGDPKPSGSQMWDPKFAVNLDGGGGGDPISVGNSMGAIPYLQET